ncbi:MAG: WYL domain-containing protein [Ilumatobacteraceae bacterium]
MAGSKRTRGPRPAHERLRRLLVMLPWLMQRGEVSVAEMAERFALTEEELVADLELASMCGLPPFVDEMIDVYIDEGTVFAGIPRVFTRPLRLTAPEGFGLLAAGRAAMALPGADPAGPLGRALDKLAIALGETPGGQGVVVDLGRPPLADLVAAATDAGERLTITYWTPSRGESSQRSITPRSVFVDDGHWYVFADDHRSGAERSFRLDRVLEATRTGAFDVLRDVTPPDPERWFAGDPEIQRMTLRLPTELLWTIERYPKDSVTAEPTAKRQMAMSIVEMPVTNEQWVRRLLIRLGPRASVLAPDGYRHLGADTARAILANYESAVSTTAGSSVD